MSSGSGRQQFGAVIGTGALLEVRTVNFRPRKVRIFNATAEEGEWQEGMADDSMFLRVAAGTLTLETSDGIIPLSDGFSIGANANLNGADELLHWEASE